MMLIDADSLRDEFENEIELDSYWACEIVDKWPTINVNNTEWISVKDKLPKDGEKVLVYYPKWRNEKYYSCVFSAEYQKRKYCDEGFGAEDVLFDIGGEDGITHWMPLPNPPEE